MEYSGIDKGKQIVLKLKSGKKVQGNEFNSGASYGLLKN